MNHFLKMLMWGLNFQFYAVEGGAAGGGAGAAGAAGGAAGAAGGTGASGGSAAGGQDPAARIAELEAQIASLKPKPGSADPDLQARARATADAAAQDASRTKQLESAIKFGLNAPLFLKQNEALLPKEVAGIFAQADKENFGDAIEKDTAVKAGLIQTFFSVQDNVDMLTAGQKATLDDYLKLTKNGKQEKAQATYDMIFEPAFEMLKRVKRAEALQRGHASGSDVEDSYRKRLMAHSRKHYLGEKTDA